MEPTDHQGRTVDFGRTAADYERHRPGFPDSFFLRLGRLGWIHPLQRTLDLGTGTGTLALGLVARGLEVTGLDLSPALLDAARRSAARRELDVRFVQGRAEATGEPDHSVELVTAGQCWWWFDAPAVIREARRVLVPGGRLLIANFSYLALPGNVAGRTEELVLRHNPGWPKAGWTGVLPDQVRDLDHGGLEEVESFSYVEEVRFTHEGWRGRMRACNGVGAALQAPEVERFDAELAELLGREFPQPLKVPHRVFAASGVLAQGARQS